jgi:hypothetical protein
MRELLGDMFTAVVAYTKQHGAMAITTNGYTRKDGTLVMGRGCAKFANEHTYGYAINLDKEWGEKIKKSGNHVYVSDHNVSYLGAQHSIKLVSFPVKPMGEYRDLSNQQQVVRHQQNKFYRQSMFVPGWACTARIDIIEQSCEELLLMCEKYPEWEVVMLPRPGCGNGELSWTETVKPIMERYFRSDKFVICSY